MDVQMTSENVTPPDDALVRLDEVLKHIPVSRSTFYAWQAKGRVPKSISIGPRTRAFKWSVVKAYLANPENWGAENG